MILNPGDQIVSDQGTVREIVNVRPSGYGWKYPEWGEKCPNGQTNYFISENSNNPFFDWVWRMARPDERVGLDQAI